MPTSSSWAARAWLLLAFLGGCRTATTRDLPVAVLHPRGTLVLGGRLIRPARAERVGFVEVSLLNCGFTSRTIYWPSPHGSASWALEDSTRAGEGLGGLCARGPVRAGWPVVIEAGQKWTLLCEADAFPVEVRRDRLLVHVTLETPEGPLAMTSTAVIGDPETVPVCDRSDGDPARGDSGSRGPRRTQDPAGSQEPDRE